MRSRLRFLVSLSLSGVLATSCATLPPQYRNVPSGYSLNPKAAGVRIVEFIPTIEREKYDEVEMVSCVLHSKSVEQNLESCMNRFKNIAHERGATLVLIKPEHRRVGVDRVLDRFMGEEFTCATCVDVKAIILRERR